MSTILQDNHLKSGCEVATEYRDLIYRCAKANSGCYDDEQELVSSVTLGLLQYSKPITYPEQFVRVMARNYAINRYRTGARQWEVVESEMNDILDGESDSSELIQHDSNASTPVDQVLLKDTLVRLEGILTPAESKCYTLLKAGYGQEDLPLQLGVTRQAVSKIIKEIRRKFTMIDRRGNGVDDYHN